MEEKESFLNKKSKQLQDVTDEKSTLNGEIRDLKDMLEVKERKIIVLQKKVSAKIPALNTSKRTIFADEIKMTVMTLEKVKTMENCHYIYYDNC